MLRSFNPMHAAFTYNVVTVTDGTALIDAGVEGQRVGLGDAPAGQVARVEVQHDAVTLTAWAIEDQPLRMAGGTDDHGVPGWEPVGNVGGGVGGEVGF